MFVPMDIEDISDSGALIEELWTTPTPRIPLNDAVIGGLLAEGKPGTPVEDSGEIERLLGL